ncbi:hypothetical protein CRUP_021927, partial [Coryphaenoides rupestris]
TVHALCRSLRGIHLALKGIAEGIGGREGGLGGALSPGQPFGGGGRTVHLGSGRLAFKPESGEDRGDTELWRRARERCHCSTKKREGFFLGFPDTFASKVAAIQDQYADASIGNVTGSNAVNVFLGIGVAWTIAAVVWRSRGKPFYVDPGSLAFSVTLFTIMAGVCVCVLLYRRRASVAGGELGGPRTCKLLTVTMFVSMWLLYILLASLEAYCHIPGF